LGKEGKERTGKKIVKYEEKPVDKGLVVRTKVDEGILRTKEIKGI
jgi:hypothetical protein